MKKVGILGCFGFGYNLANGQTVKTRNLSAGFKKYTSISVTEIDSFGWSKNPIKLLCSIKDAFIECDTVIMLPAHNGIRVFAPLFSFFKKRYKKRIIYDVIGGWLPEYLKEHPNLKKTLKNFDGIWVETEAMRYRLCDVGFDNVVVVPNFKELTPLDETELLYPEKFPLKLCTFSRVSKEKGIEDAVYAVRAANEKLGKTIFSIDIYGQIDSDYRERFGEISSVFPDYVKYCGCVEADKSTATLKNYFALLFPTYYEGEGFAGTLIDAYSAGIPVIASDWRYNPELVSKKTGYVYPARDNDVLVNILVDVGKTPDKILAKKQGCLEEAQKYKAEVVIRYLETLM